MPKRSRFPKYPKKTQRGRRRRNRKFNRYTKKPRMYRSLPIGMPHTYACKLRYCFDQSVDVAVGSYAQQIIRANSCYDPDYTGTGHQPRFFDQLMAMYGKAYVVASTAYIRAMNAGTSNQQPVDLSIYLHEDAAYTSGMTQYRDAVESKYRKGGPITLGTPTSQHDSNTQWLVSHFNAKKFFNLKQIVGDVHYASSASGNPDRECFHQVLLRHVLSNDPGAVRLECRVVYYVVFTDPIYVSNS